MNCYIVLDEICRYSAAAELRIFCACLVGLCICAGASLLHVQFYLRFPFTRAFHTCAVYMPIPLQLNPYPQNDHYRQFHYTRIKSTRNFHEDPISSFHVRLLTNR